MGLFDRFFKSAEKAEPTDVETLNRELNQGLEKTRHGFMDKLFGMISGKEIDDDLYEDLEEALISGDVGVNTALELVENLRERERKDKLKTAEDLQAALAEELQARLAVPDAVLAEVPGALNIILVVGVNGVGKTTSIGKLAYLLQGEGKRVLLAAADTFRAAASEQLKIWGDRVGCGVIAHQEGADPAAVVTTGQNALSQAKAFSEATGLTGVILTKLDGTAKGGVVIGINSEYDLPVKFVGVGEQMDQLLPFNASDFASALFAGIQADEAGSDDGQSEEETPDQEAATDD